MDEQPRESLRLELVANVRPDFRVDPSSIRFRSGTPGVASVAISPGRLDKVKLRQAYATHRAFTVKSNLDEGRVELAFDPSAWPGGDVRAELVLETDSAHEPRHGVEIRVE